MRNARRRLVLRGHAPRIARGATPRTCASGSMSTSEASCHGRELPCAATRRELPGVQPPRTCAGSSMSTSEASCHRRELSRAATRRELPGVQPPRTCASGSMSTSGSELPKARIVPHGHVLNLAAPCFQSSAYTSQNSGTGSSCSAPTASRSGPPRSSRSGTPCPPLSGPWPRPSRSRF